MFVFVKVFKVCTSFLKNLRLYCVKTRNKDGKIKEAREMAATAGLESNDDARGADDNGKREVAEKKCKMVGEGTHFIDFIFGPLFPVQLVQN